MIENSCTVLNPFNRCKIHYKQRGESSSEYKLSARKARAISAISLFYVAKDTSSISFQKQPSLRSGFIQKNE